MAYNFLFIVFSA